MNFTKKTVLFVLALTFCGMLGACGSASEEPAAEVAVTEPAVTDAPVTTDADTTPETETVPETTVPEEDTAPETPAPEEAAPVENGVTLLDENGLTINLKTELPKEFNYCSSDKILSSMRIDEMTCKAEYSEYSGEYTLTLYFTGEKTYDKDGEGDSDYTSLDVKVYDDEGYVVESKTYMTNKLCVGEKYRNEEYRIYGLESGTYTIELSDHNI